MISHFGLNGSDEDARQLAEGNLTALRFRHILARVSGQCRPQLKGVFLMTVMQRVAICFAAGVVGALAVVVLSHIMFALGLSQKLGVMAPVSLKSRMYTSRSSGAGYGGSRSGC
jgi:hypothetical protein